MDGREGHLLREKHHWLGLLEETVFSRGYMAGDIPHSLSNTGRAPDVYFLTVTTGMSRSLCEEDTSPLSPGKGKREAQGSHLAVRRAAGAQVF